MTEIPEIGTCDVLCTFKQVPAHSARQAQLAKKSAACKLAGKFWALPSLHWTDPKAADFLAAESFSGAVSAAHRNTNTQLHDLTLRKTFFSPSLLLPV